MGIFYPPPPITHNDIIVTVKQPLQCLTHPTPSGPAYLVDGPLLDLTCLSHLHTFLLQALMGLLDERLTGQSPQPTLPTCDGISSPQKKPMVYRSVYREILFLTLVSLSQDNIDLTAFDREYSRAFADLPEKYKDVLQKSDYPPDKQVAYCRKIFRELRI